MTLDERGNIVEVGQFESFLAKYFLENPGIFQGVRNKILDAVEQLIVLNAKHERFNRLLYLVFSILTSEGYPEIEDMKALRASNSVVLFDTFCKYFSEGVMELPDLILPLEQESSLAQPVERTLTQTSFFKAPKLNEAQFLSQIRPAVLYADTNRGTVAAEERPERRTKNLGILSVKYLPDALKNYFAHPHAPSRQYHQPKEDSLMGMWLRKHYLPIISGASGGVSKTLNKLRLLSSFSSAEYQLLGLLIASSTVALGHHSFFEVIAPLSLLTKKVREQDSLLAFYEQVIPEEIRSLPSYQQHMEQYAPLINEFNFDKPEAEFERLVCMTP